MARSRPSTPSIEPTTERSFGRPRARFSMNSRPWATPIHFGTTPNTTCCSTATLRMPRTCCTSFSRCIPSRIGGYRLLAQAESALGNTGAALYAVRRALALAPDSKPAQRLEKRILAAAGKGTSAE